LLGDVPQGKRVMPLAIMTIADLENLESSVVEFGMRQLLSDYTEAHPDGLVSLHNFMVYDERYADKIKPSAQLIADSETPDPPRATRIVSGLSGSGNRRARIGRLSFGTELTLIYAPAWPPASSPRPSLAGFLPAIGISISFCPAAALRAFLAGFFGASVACRRASSDALAQRVHQVHHVFAAGDALLR